MKASGQNLYPQVNPSIFEAELPLGRNCLKAAVSRLRYIGNTSEVKETKNFAEDFIERLKFVGKASEEELDKIASKTSKNR
ncbi:MAG: hypothetical protein AAB583_01245 [Patescibacteria group bacterium]